MKRRTEQSKTGLKNEILRVASDTKMGQLKKILSIVGMGAPKPSVDTRILEYSIDSTIWNELKSESEFWAKILTQIGLPDYDAVDKEDNTIFGIASIYAIMGANWFYQVISQLSSDVEDDPVLLKKALRRQFYEYVTWFDSQASINYLILYANYLNIMGQLEPIASTRKQKAVPAPFFKTVEIPPPSTAKERKTEQVQVRPLDLRKEEFFYVNSTLLIVNTMFNNDGTKSDIDVPMRYFFYMRQKTQSPSLGEYVFNIVEDKRVLETKTRGPITRVLKFFIDPYIYLVIQGERDRKLLQVNRVTMDNVTIVSNYFDEIDATMFDDLLYVNKWITPNVATHQTSVSHITDLRILNTSVLSGLYPLKRTIQDLKPDEKKLFTRQQLNERVGAGKDRPLTQEEQNALVEIRRIQGLPEPSGSVLFSELDQDDIEISYIRKKINYVSLESKFGNLFTLLPSPLAPVFVKSGLTAYNKNDVECLATRVLSVPYPTSRLYLHVGIIARKYTSNTMGENRGVNNSSAYTTVLYIYRYRYSINTRLYSIDKELQFVLDDFIQKSAIVKQFNVIFHSNKYLHVELIQQESSESKQTFTRNSRIVHYDLNPSFIESRILPPPPSNELIKDFTLLDTLRKNGYQTYDYRHNIVLGESSKYDCVFYKYLYASSQARIIFYKSREGVNTRPGVSDLFITRLTPRRIIALTPMRSANNIAYLQIRVPEKEIGFFRITGQQELPAYEENKFSLSHALDVKLSLNESIEMDVTQPSYCVSCGHYTNTRDTITGNFYCDEMCQYLFCETDEL